MLLYKDMNNTNIEVNTVLAEMNNSNVVIKMANGRAISGFLKNDGSGYTVKLGVLHIPLDPRDVVKVSTLN